MRLPAAMAFAEILRAFRVSGRRPNPILALLGLYLPILTVLHKPFFWRLGSPVLPWIAAGALVLASGGWLLFSLRKCC